LIVSFVALALGTAQQVERGRAIACASLHHNGDPPYRGYLPIRLPPALRSLCEVNGNMQAPARMVRASHRSTLTALVMALALLVVGSPHAPAQPATGDAKSAEATAAQETRQTHRDRLRQQLRLLGLKFTLLREGWKQLLKRDKTPLSRAQEEVLAKDRQSSETVGIGVIRAPAAAVAEYALIGGPDDGMSRVVIPVSDNQQITVVRTEAVKTAKGVIWRGTVEDTGDSAVLLWWKDGRLTGEFGHKGHIFTVMNMGGDLHAVLEIDPKMMPRDHPSSSEGIGQPQPRSAPPLPKVEPISSAELKALEAKTIVIDVMMLYTKRAASHYMRDPADRLELAIERVNESFRDSGLGNISLRLVHTQVVDYDERGSDEFTDLYHVVDGDDLFKDVRRLRNEKHADIVGMVVDDPTGCGLSTRIAPDSEEAYFVVHYACAAIAMSIAHEIGHILGARHDRWTDPINTPIPYGHGYVNGTKWRDIMSYPESCGGCPRIPIWSNPRVLYKGEPTGTLTEDNARVILEQAERVSKFR
jgi:peptidyl-Asp metalloendopeptidase